MVTVLSAVGLAFAAFALVTSRGSNVVAWGLAAVSLAMLWPLLVR